MLHPKVKEQSDKTLQYLQSLGLPVEKKNLNQEKGNILTAFVHKSFASDYTGEYSYNERLEFLGDGILGAVINKFLFLNFPDFAESKLSLYKSILVREETLATIAREIHLGSYVFVSHGEEKMKGRDKASVLSDTLEAIIGAIYIDFGYEVVEEFIKKFIYIKIDTIQNTKYHPIKSYKTTIQEMIQKEYKIIPEYKDSEYKISKSGNIEVYKSEIFINNKKESEGFGPSKKKAQEDAAKNLREKTQTKELD